MTEHDSPLSAEAEARFFAPLVVEPRAAPGAGKKQKYIHTVETIQRATSMGIPDLEELSIANLTAFYAESLKAGAWGSIPKGARRRFRQGGVTEVSGREAARIRLTIYGLGILEALP